MLITISERRLSNCDCVLPGANFCNLHAPAAGAKVFHHFPGRALTNSLSGRSDFPLLISQTAEVLRSTLSADT